MTKRTTEGRTRVAGMSERVGQKFTIFTATVEVDGIEGWTISAEVKADGIAGHLTRLTFTSDGSGRDLLTDHLRLVAPRRIVDAMLSGWVTVSRSNVDAGELDRTPSGRARRDDDYLGRLSVAFLEAQRARVPRIRRHLADAFGRTESQIRDDLTMATRQKWLAMAYPRSTTRHPGDRMRRERPADFDLYNKGARK